MRQFIQDYTSYVSGIWNKNRPGFLSRYRYLLLLAVLACLADCLTTIYFLVYDPDLIETHPVVRYICQGIGPIPGAILGKLGQFIFLFGLSVFLRRWAAYLLCVASGLYFYAAWYNIWGYKIYTPLFVRLLEPLTWF